MAKLKWIKPSGIEIETNGLEETIKAAAELGWEPADKPKEAPKKRGRKPKGD